MKQILLSLVVMALVGCGKNKKEDLITTWTSDPSNPQNVIVEAAIREELKKPTGELTKADLEKVKTLSFWMSNITNEGVKDAAKLKQLEDLSLNHTKITDECLKEVAKLPKLRTLGLWDTQITDAGIREVAKLTQLESLNLGATKITNRGLKEVSKLTKLTYLNLRYIDEITDEGLKELAKCKQLENLYLGKWLDAPVELQKALPNCKISHNAKK